MPYTDKTYHAPLNWDDMQFTPWRGCMADVMEATRSAVLERMAVAYGVILPSNSYYQRHLTDLRYKMELLKNFQIGGEMLFDFCQVVDMCMDAMITCFNERFTASVDSGKPYYHGSNTSGNWDTPRGFFLIPDAPVVLEDGYLYYNYITPSWMFSNSDRNWKIPLQECTPGSIPTKFPPVFERVRNALDVMYRVPCQLFGYLVGYGTRGYRCWDLAEGESYLAGQYRNAINTQPTDPTVIINNRNGSSGDMWTIVFYGGAAYSLDMEYQECRIRGLKNAFPDCDIEVRLGIVYDDVTGYSQYTKRYNGPGAKGVLLDGSLGYTEGPYHTFENGTWGQLPEFPFGTGSVSWPAPVAGGILLGYQYRFCPYANFYDVFKFSN